MRYHHDIGVFPTLVGVFPSTPIPTMEWQRLPHACGGVSWANWSSWAVPESSPRLWGCFLPRSSGGDLQYVFPTLVGVFLGDRGARFGDHCLPHACGGVSNAIIVSNTVDVSSPRLWGCFPARAGGRHPAGSLPHACGGVSFVKLRRCR